jgi:hypothetical protein
MVQDLTFGGEVKNIDHGYEMASRLGSSELYPDGRFHNE